MKRLLLLAALCVASFSVFAQFRMVGTVGTWTTVNSTTYTGTINFQSDLTGQSYLATAISDTFRLFTGTEQMYQVDSVWNKTFSSASVRIVRTNGAGAPSGQVLVFNPDGRQTIPQGVFGSTGATAQVNAAVDAWNARQIGGGAVAAAMAYDSLISGNVTALVKRFGGTATTIANPSGGEYNLVISAGADFQSASVFGNNTTLNGSNEMIIRVNNAANTRSRRITVQLYDANNNALVDQQTTATVNTQAVSAGVTTITIPGLNGFAGTGFYVEIR